MAAVKKRLKRPKLLSHTRPPTARAQNPKLSAKATRNLIRTHHRLLKSRAQALKAGNEDLVREIDERIEAMVAWRAINLPASWDSRWNVAATRVKSLWIGLLRA